MAVNLWFSVIVFVWIQQVSGRNCNNFANINSCDDCIRCGGFWCNTDYILACVTEEERSTVCNDSAEERTKIEEIIIPGTQVNSRRKEMTAFINEPKTTPLHYPIALAGNQPKIAITIVNTTQSFNFKLANRTNCFGSNCTTLIEAVPETEFCSQTGRASEFVEVKVDIDDIQENITLKYHIPCACGCSDKVEKNSPICHSRGDFSCGVCSCHNGWIGQNCERAVCDYADRGDVQLTCKNGQNVECSGNGVCGPCETCECFTDRVGSMYFDKDSFCSDICMQTSECDSCLRNPSEGPCEDCPHQLIVEPYNETVSQQRNFANRSIWVECNETMADNCHLNYFAMRDGNSRAAHVMIVKLCDVFIADKIKESTGSVVILPLVLGLVAVLGAGAAGAAYAVWRARAQDALKSSEYTSMNANNCTVENPIFQPATTFFKNPTYGKCETFGS